MLIGYRRKWLESFMILGISAAISLLPAISAEAAALQNSLQEMINETKAGDILRLPAGSYSGAVVIDKPLTIAAEEGAVLRIEEGLVETALTIKADHVSISGLRIEDGTVKEQPTLMVEGDYAKLENVTILTGSFGIQLRSANEAKISHTRIEWIGLVGGREPEIFQKGNGIDLYESDGNLLIDNIITGMHDGIYLENSDDNQVLENRFEELRYGVHCMYTKNILIRDNIGTRNVTGAMIMGVQNVEVSHNTFTKQSENVNSQGILLFDAHHSLIESNQVEGNRVGVYVEESSENEIANNEILSNFIGIQMLNAEDNTVKANRFIGNVANAEARNSANNILDRNYWDTFSGIDTDGDGSSDISYAINPFFQTLIKQKPGFQLFFQSPGMMFLENLYRSGSESWPRDQHPLMKPGDGSVNAMQNSLKKTGLAGGMLLIAAIYLIIMGVRRR
ncbi:NosD domain-containing protein [Paenibacillus sp. HB172176]|uniref:right-handed parallel beta-helix repeat-containing protein n=1 Tax=Paenibacillus sp. HB172176 TaxID=2493690 RepID=UPI00143C3C86|nr:NosD domain-containing protein [Paenibacillus sp. HB172176]